MTDDSIGMMDKAYFVGKQVLIQWLNELLNLRITKIEECATAAVYCGVMDCLFPGTFQYSRVKWQAKHEHEFVENYKILQGSFDKNGVKRHIDVAKLIKARYQDNLEFCQWLKAFFDKHYNGEPYDGLGRRKGQDLYYIGIGGKIGTTQQPTAKANNAPYQAKPAATSAPSTGIVKKPVSGGGSSSQMEQQVYELKLTNQTLEKERDFYFGKLRDIEILLQARGGESSGNPLAQDILKILYASEEEKVQVSSDGSLLITSAAKTSVEADEDME